jgi:hypothetical protein
MSYFCMSCKHDTEASPCEHCGSEKIAFVLTDFKVLGYTDTKDTTLTLNPIKSEDKRIPRFLFSDMPEFSMKIELTPEQAEKLNQMLPKFDTSQFIGLPCATCGEPFTQAFFDAGGTMIRASDDRWQHDHCSSQN